MGQDFDSLMKKAEISRLRFVYDQACTGITEINKQAMRLHLIADEVDRSFSDPQVEKSQINLNTLHQGNVNFARHVQKKLGIKPSSKQPAEELVLASHA